jgi:hypothetical protein
VTARKNCNRVCRNKNTRESSQLRENTKRHFFQSYSSHVSSTVFGLTNNGCLYEPYARIYRPGFTKTSPKRSFSLNRKRAFWLVFVKTGSIISGTRKRRGLWTTLLGAAVRMESKHALMIKLCLKSMAGPNLRRLFLVLFSFEDYAHCFKPKAPLFYNFTDTIKARHAF